MTEEELQAALRAYEVLAVFKNIEQGAATTIWCAVSPQLNGKGGVYCENCDIAPIFPADSRLPAGVRPWAVDKAAAEALWALSEKLTSVSITERTAAGRSA
jgi:hypothetical protein